MAYGALRSSSGTGSRNPAGYRGNPDEPTSLAQAFDQTVRATKDDTSSSGTSSTLQSEAWQAALISLAKEASTPGSIAASASTASHEITPDGPSGSGVSRSYDASGATLSTTTTTAKADGSRVELVDDTGGTQAWSSVQNSYNAAGALFDQQVQYRDKHATTVVVDPASGKVSSSNTTQADGTQLDTTYDLSGLQPWVSTTLHKDAAGHVTEQDVQNRDGSATQTGYDAKGVADLLTTTNADGSSSTSRTNTASQPYGSQAWSTIQDSHDAAGNLTDEVAHNLSGTTTSSHYDVARKEVQLQTTRNADGTSTDIVDDTSATQTYSSYDVHKDAAGHVTSQDIFNRDGSIEKALYTPSGAVQSSTTTNADHSSSVYSPNADGSYKTDDYTAAGQLADEVVVHSATSFTKTVYQSVNGTATAEASYQFNADGSWVENDLDDAIAGSPLLVQQVHNVNGTETDYVHAPEGGQSYSSYTVQKDATGTVTEEDIQGTDGSYTQDLYAAGKLAKSTKDAKDGSYAITYLNTGTQPWAFQTYNYNAQGQYSGAVSYYTATAGKAAYWTQDNWTPSTETWTGQSTHFDNGTEYDVVIGGASDNFSFYTAGKDAAGTVRQQTVVNADGSAVVLGSDSTGHIDSRTILPVGGGYDQEVVNAAGQTSAIVSHGADSSQIVQAFTTGGAPGTAQTLSYQSLYDSAGSETDALLVGKDGSRSEETYGADGQVLTAKVTGADGTLVSAATYGAGGAEASATTLNADGSHTVTGFDASGQVQTVSFTHADGSGASFVVEAGGSVSAGQAVLNQVSVSLAEQILAQPADDKHTVSQKVTLPDGELYNVTMDASGKVVAKHEHPNGILGDIEEVAGTALNVLAFVPGVNVVAAPLAVAWDAAQAGESFSQGNVLGGVLNLGSAAGVGLVGAASGVFGQGVTQGLVSLSGAGSAQALGVIGQGVLEGTAVVGGAAGIAQGIKSGDPLAIAAGGLEVAAAGVSGLVTSGQLDAALGADATGVAAAKASTILAGQVALGAGLGSAALGSADAAEHGDWLGSIGGLLAAVASSGPTAADDLFGTAASEDDPFTGPGVADTSAATTTTTANASGASIEAAAERAAASTAALAGGMGTTGDDAGAKNAVTTTSGGGATASTGQLGWVSNSAPDELGQSGGPSATEGGTDTSATVHIDVEPISTKYASNSDAPTATEANQGFVPGAPLAAAAGSVAVAGGIAEGDGIGALLNGAKAVAQKAPAFAQGALESAALPVVAGAITLFWPTSLADDTLNALPLSSLGGVAGGSSGQGSSGSASDLSDAPVNTGNLAEMTGLDREGSKSTIEYLDLAPALPAAPGFTSTLIPSSILSTPSSSYIPVMTTAGSPPSVVGLDSESLPASDFNASIIMETRQSPGADVQTVGGRYPINSSYAGSTYPASNMPSDLAAKYPNGVDFTPQGFPDFSPYAKAGATLSGLTGSNPIDANAANEALGLPSTPDGYTWHHVEDGQTMQLVPTDLHSQVRHTGGGAIIRNGSNGQ